MVKNIETYNFYVEVHSDKVRFTSKNRGSFEDVPMTDVKVDVMKYINDFDKIIDGLTKRTVKIKGFNQEIELELINEYEDDFEVKYTHPSTGQECQEIEQIKTGWSFQNQDDNANFENLIEAIKKMDEDGMTFEWCQDADELDIEETPYGTR